MEHDLIIEIAKQGIVVSLLLLAIIWLNKTNKESKTELKEEIKEKEKIIKELQDEKSKMQNDKHELEKTFIEGYSKVCEVIKEIHVEQTQDIVELTHLVNDWGKEIRNLMDKK